MYDVSVIIPVYNVEKYLNECLNSVCSQTLTNIEIICVNDGSTDGSADILTEYAEKDNRIKIISQANQGLAASRNNGLKEATGKYVYFLDSDDYIEPICLEKLVNNAVLNDSDVVLFKFQKVDDFKNIHNRGIEFRIDEIFGDIDYDNFSFTYHDIKRHVMNSAFSACLKLYKRQFIESYEFHIGVNFEDVPVHVKVMVNAGKISFVPEFLYNYRSNPDSILNSTANGFDIFKVIDMVEDYLRQNGFYSELEDEFIFFKIAQILLYMDSEKSDEYFFKAKEEFSKITVKNPRSLKKYAIKGYNCVLKSNSYEDYHKKGKSKKTKNNKFLNIIKNLTK